jgi:hypothetical protein
MPGNAPAGDYRLMGLRDDEKINAAVVRPGQI